MSNEEGDDTIPNDTEPQENGKKKITLADATHILNAEALRQFVLGQNESETNGEEVEGEKAEGDRALGESGQGLESKDKEKGNVNVANLDTGQPGGADTLANSDSNLNESSNQGEESSQIINNSEQRVSGLGDNSIDEKETRPANEKTNQPSLSNKTDSDIDPGRAAATTKPNSEESYGAETGNIDNVNTETRNTIDNDKSVTDSDKPVLNETSSLLEKQETPSSNEEKKLMMDGGKNIGDSNVNEGNMDNEKNEKKSDSMRENKQESTTVNAESTEKGGETLKSGVVDKSEELSKAESGGMSTFQGDGKQVNDIDGADMTALQKENAGATKVEERKSENNVKSQNGSSDVNEADSNINEDKLSEKVSKIEKPDSVVVESSVEHKRGKDGEVAGDGQGSKDEDIAKGVTSKAGKEEMNGSKDDSIDNKEYTHGGKEINKDNVKDESNLNADNEDLDVKNANHEKETHENKGDKDDTVGVKSLENSEDSGEVSNIEKNKESEMEGKGDSDSKNVVTEDGLVDKSNAKTDVIVEKISDDKTSADLKADGKSDIKDTEKDFEKEAKELNKSSDETGDEEADGKDNKNKDGTGKGDEVKTSDGTDNERDEGKGAVKSDNDNINKDGAKNDGGSNIAKSDDDEHKKGDAKDNGSSIRQGNEKGNEDGVKIDDGKENQGDEQLSDKKSATDVDNEEYHQDGDENEAGDAIEKEADRTLPKDFYYDYDDIVSKPKTTEGVPEDMFKMYHSFGFECTKRSNMHMLDAENILFAAGNVVQILNISLGQMKYIRTIGGGGVGAIAVHPSRKFFAVAEKGDKPSIMIYEYPSLRVYRVLREGTEKAYANLDFSPNGDKLASVGSAPDYMLTVWDWINENIELRSKAFSQDIFKVAFSPENEGHLCTSGTGHIRFWIMAATFTGLKLQGELGRFGTTELSDIAGFVELPDGKVLSGSEWGNMLLWDGGLIKAEIARKGKKTCHNGMIMEFFLDEGELITIGIDGYVKVWDFESIDTAEAVDESKIFEMEPMSELKVGSDVKLVSMVKSVNTSDASIWYAQDGSGGIWKLDLSFSHTSQAPKRLYSFHAGPIQGLAVSTMTHLSASVGADHTVRLYDYLAKNQVCHSRYTAPGTSIIWMPKTVDPDGLSILAGFQDGVIRQLTVVKRDQNATKKNTITYELKLTQVFKPHVKAVTALAVSKDGKFLATGSDDSTVFFFSINKTYKPIGFIETGGAVASLDWSSTKKKSTLLICGKDGCVLEVSCPSADQHDTTKTFLIPLEGLKRSEFKFKSIKDRLVKEEEDVRKAKEEKERQKKKEEEKRKKRERGIVEEEEEEGGEGEEGEGDEEEEGKDKTPKEEEEIHEESQIVNGFYKGDTGHFWVLLDGWDAGYIYECAFDNDVIAEPLKAVKFEEINDVPVRSHCFSKNGQYMALGLDNGSIRVQLLESGDIDTLDSYWSQNMHDNHYGAVTSVSLSFDERFLLSVGKDGNFFVYSFMDEEKLKQIIGKHKADIAKKLDSAKISRIDDIEDPNHYSIELEKQKAEYDRMVRLAEEKKQETRQTVNLLRIEFKRLLSRNQEMPPYLQLPQTDFIIDPKMKDNVDAETQVKLNLLEKEMAWESEKHLLSLQKLKTRFKEVIECELFRLHSFNSEHCVSSYRAAVLPSEFNEALEGTKKERKTTEGDLGVIPLISKRSSILTRKVRQQSLDDSVHEDKGDGNALQSVKSKPFQKLDGKIAKAIEKVEQNRKRRMERKAKWDELYRSKPDANYEDPANVAAIKEAQENMGDFKLKSADDYIVPEKERVNADKKRAQIIHLKDMIHQLKTNFNEKLLNLRNGKIVIIAEVKSLIDQLEIVQSSLPLSMHVSLPLVPVLHPEEQPEALFDYTPATLERFKKEQEAGEKSLKGENAGSFGGGFGGFGAGEQTHQPSTKLTSQLTSTKTDQRSRSISILSTLSSLPRSNSSFAVDHGSPETISEEVTIDDEPSDMEMRIREEQKIRLAYQRDMLLQKIKDLLRAFDAELRLLRHEKTHLDVDLKNADLRMITLFEELVLLKEFEKRENLLMGKVLQKMQEKDEMEEKVDDCEVKLQLKKGEIEKLQEKEKALSTMFSNLFLESNKFEPFLTKVYKKKVKRVKKTEQNAGSDEDSDEDLSDDDYDSEENEDSDAEELDDSVCPPGCDQALFDQVCQLREKRLDLEEATAEEKKSADALKKELDALKKKAKVIESNLVSAEADLEAFQREKQQKLNELDIVVTLKLNQLQYLNNNALPQDLSQCLVFTSSSLEKLQKRISELDKEKAEQKRHFWKLRQQHVQLIRDKKTMENKISELEEKVKQMQLLKFGRLVDLEKLETVSVNRAAEELKEQLRSQEFSNAKEMAAWEKRIDDAKAKLTQVTRENTQRLDTYTVLLEEKKGLEQTLDSRQKSLGGEFQGNRQTDYQERQRLIQLVQLQSQEIDALKEEIGLLSRKGGHILPPSQARISNATPAAR